MSRYRNKTKVFIDKDTELYRKFLDSRNTGNIEFYRSDTNLSIDYSFILRQEYLTFTWSVNSRMYKYAYEIMGDQNLWWIIAIVNKKPTDAHWTVGETVYVPTSPENFLTAVGV